MVSPADDSPQLAPGLRGEERTVVSLTNTTDRAGIRVFSTPSLVALMERAAAAAVQPYLPPGWSTVGSRIDIRHLAPTPEGHEVVARAELVAVEGRRLMFRVSAFDPFEQVGEADHERYLINLERYRGRLARKLQAGI